MLHEPLIKVALSILAMPLASGFGWLIAQSGNIDLGALVEKLGLVGALIAIIVFLVQERKARDKRSEEREEKIAERLDSERNLYRESLAEERKLYRADLRELTEAIKSSGCKYQIGFRNYNRRMDGRDEEDVR